MTTGDNLYCPADSQPDEYTQIDTGDGNTNCCSLHYYDSPIKKYDTGTDKIAGQERTTTINENDKELCCLYGEHTVQKDTNYAATGATSITRTKICNPTFTTLGADTKATLAFTIGTTDYYCVGGEIKTPNASTLSCTGGKWVSITNNEIYDTPTDTTKNINFYYENSQKMELTDTPLQGGWLVGELLTTTETESN